MNTETLERLHARDFLFDLLSRHSPSGFEDEVRFLLYDYLSPFADRFETDLLGNSIALLNPDAPMRIMITAHQDEIGAQITSIDERGYLFFRRIGSPNFLRWTGGEVEILTRSGKRVPAILLNEKTDHFNDESFEACNLFLDIGASGRAEAEALVAVGDYIVSRANLRRLAGTRLMSKGLDDKIGLYSAALAFRLLAEDCPGELGICFVGASQEEVGSRGIRVAAQHLMPHAAFVIDVTGTADFPGGNPRIGTELRLGKGPGVFRNPNNTPALQERMLLAGKTQGIPYQLTPHWGAVSSTDAAPLQINGAGVATVLLAIPNRYMHSQTEVVDMTDAENAAELIAASIRTLSADDDFLPPLHS